MDLAESPGGAYATGFDFSSEDHDRPSSPAHALVLAFSNFSNRLAYWTQTSPGQLWVSDLDYQNPELVFTDSSNQYPANHPPSPDFQLRLIWSPDDRNLIVDTSSETVPDLIYHIQTKTLEQWPWQCDRVAVSPRTRQLATWCSSTAGRPDFAVMEWQGDIWYSPTPPITEIVQGLQLRPPDWVQQLLQTWAWSPDGGQIAYFSPVDSLGQLHIARATGDRLTILPGSIKDTSDKSLLVAKDLRWSQDGKRLLLYAFGTKEQPCPQQLNLTGVGSKLLDRPCWLVVDAHTGDVLWTPLQSAEAMMKVVPQPQADITLWHFDNAAISPDENRLAIGLSNGPLAYGYVVNLETGVVQQIPTVQPFVRWAVAP